MSFFAPIFNAASVASSSEKCVVWRLCVSASSTSTIQPFQQRENDASGIRFTSVQYATRFDTKSQHRHIPMKQPHRRPPHRPNLKTPPQSAAETSRGRNSGLFGSGSAKRIPKTSHQRLLRRLVRPQVQRAAFHMIEPPHIIQPHDVIRVRMGNDNRINPINPIRHALQPQLRRRIDQHANVTIRDNDRRPRAFIMRIGAVAHCAMTPNHRHAGAGAGAKEKQFDLLACVNGIARLMERKYGHAPSGA